MERLTRDRNSHGKLVGVCNGDLDMCVERGCNRCPHFAAILNKLAEYERIGVEAQQTKPDICNERKCGYKSYFIETSNLPDCNSCLAKDVCKFCPKAGQYTRINCPFFKSRYNLHKHE